MSAFIQDPAGYTSKGENAAPWNGHILYYWYQYSFPNVYYRSLCCRQCRVHSIAWFVYCTYMISLYIYIFIYIHIYIHLYIYIHRVHLGLCMQRWSQERNSPGDGGEGMARGFVARSVMQCGFVWDGWLKVIMKGNLQKLLGLKLSSMNEYELEDGLH